MARIFTANGKRLESGYWANAAATVFESFSSDTSMVEGAGSTHLSSEVDNVMVFSPELFTYNAHRFTGLPARVVPQGPQRSGDDPVFDRQLFGRALLNDVGAHPEGGQGSFAHVDEALRFVNALIDFGYFKDDRKTEMIPYWRIEDIVDFIAVEGGNKQDVDDVFISAYRRPARNGGFKAMLVIMNEEQHAVRGMVNFRDLERLLRGMNVLTVSDIAGNFRIPAGSGDAMDSALAGWRKSTENALLNMESGAFVTRAADGAGKLYGPVYIPRHDYMLLFARGPDA
ncbi:MAG: hypothetical protein R6V03_02140 [Kiritimatiellia bacterium]